jgi:hypothetical protein
MIQLFTVGENSMAELNKAWISLIPEFRRLLARDKGGPMDGSGKYKKQAQREFTYIFLRYDFTSPYENMEELEREVISLQASGMERGRMESDGDLWEAIRMYNKLQETRSVTMQTYRELKESTQDLSTYIRSMDLYERTEQGAKVHSPKEKQDAINGMPKTMLTLKELEEAVKQELSGDPGLRGDATKGYDEDADD